LKRESLANTTSTKNPINRRRRLPRRASTSFEPGDRERLLTLTRAPTAPAGLVQRARIVLLAADGVGNTDIAERLQVARQTVVTWRKRYVDGGMGALEDADRPGRPVVHDDVAVVVATLEAPPQRLGVTLWSSRLLADHLGISFATVTRIWRKWNLQPWRVQTFKFSTDPEHAADHMDDIPAGFPEDLPQGSGKGCSPAAASCRRAQRELTLPNRLSRVPQRLGDVLRGQVQKIMTDLS